MVYYHEADRHAEKLVHYLQFQGHGDVLCHQNMIISATSSRLLVDLQPTSIISWSVLWRNLITAFKVKDRA